MPDESQHQTKQRLTLMSFLRANGRAIKKGYDSQGLLGVILVLFMLPAAWFGVTPEEFEEAIPGER